MMLNKYSFPKVASVNFLFLSSLPSPPLPFPSLPFPSLPFPFFPFLSLLFSFLFLFLFLLLKQAGLQHPHTLLSAGITGVDTHSKQEWVLQ
jgi:hypothetical protein